MAHSDTYGTCMKTWREGGGGGSMRMMAYCHSQKPHKGVLLSTNQGTRKGDKMLRWIYILTISDLGAAHVKRQLKNIKMRTT